MPLEPAYFDVFEVVDFDGFELYKKGFNSQRLAKVQHDSPISKVLDLLFGADGKKKKFVLLEDIFPKGIPVGKRMDKIVEGLQIDKRARDILFKYDAHKVRLNARVDVFALQRTIPLDENSPVIKWCRKVYGIPKPAKE